jgi:hypothetical protein
VAGVDHEVIVADYAATQERMLAILERLLPAAAYQHLAEEVPAFMLNAQPGMMRRFLHELDQIWGGILRGERSASPTLDEWRKLFVSS